MKRLLGKNPIIYIILLGGLYYLKAFLPPVAGNYVPEQVALNPPTSSISSQEDPAKRRHWEWQMTRNPLTESLPADIHLKELAFGQPFYQRAQNQRTSQNWQSVGPNNVGGRTRALAVDRTNEAIWLAGGVSGGMFRSTNSGQSWVKTTLPHQLQSVTCVWQDTRLGEEQTWYYGTGELIGNSARGGGNNAAYRGDGVYKSTDGGQSWKPLEATQTNTPETYDNPFNYIYSIVQSATTGWLYVATSGGVFVSKDGGSSFAPTLNPPIDTDTQRYLTAWSEVYVSSNGTLFASLSPVFPQSGNFQSNLYTSDNGGITWAAITSNSPTNFGRVVIHARSTEPGMPYFFVNASADQALLYQYTGFTLTNLTANLPASGENPQDLDLQDGYNMVVRAYPNSTTVFIGGTNLYRSKSGFTTDDAEQIGGYVTEVGSAALYPNHHPDQHNLLFMASGPAVAISAHDGGLSVTQNINANEVQWQEVNNQYRTSQFYAVGLDENSVSDLILGGLQDNGTQGLRSTAKPASWQRVIGGDGGYTHVAYEGAYVYTSFQNSQIYRLQLNNNFDLLSFARVDPAGAGKVAGQEYLFINPYVFDPTFPNRMYLAGGDIIYRNLNVSQIANGSQEPTSTNWDALPQTRIASGSVSAIAISRTKPANRLYYGTTEGEIYRVDSIDAKALVTRLQHPEFPEDAYLAHIDINPLNANELLIAFSNYEIQSIFYSQDAGKTFTHVGGNLEENPDGSGSGPSVRHVEIIPTLTSTDTTYLYLAGTSTGLYSTTSISATSQWTLESPDGIGQIVVPNLQYRSIDGRVVVATHGNGVYLSDYDNILPLPSTSEGKPFAISAVYPNPYHLGQQQKLSLKFTIPSTGLVRIRLYNSLGKRISQPLFNRQLAGDNEVFISTKTTLGQALAPGVYVVRIDYGEQSLSQKFVIVN